MLPGWPLRYSPAKDAKNPDPPKSDAVAELDIKIVDQIKADEPALKADLTYLAEHIGPRLTGSAKLDEASHWTMEQFKAAGLANAHLEDWTIANSWTRGPASGRIITPSEETLTLATAGWVPGAKGNVRGNGVARTVC